MKRLIPTLLSLLAACLLLVQSSCSTSVTAAGKLQTKTVKLNKFSELDASRAVEVIFTPQNGSTPKATITADANIMPYVVVENRGKGLYVTISPAIKNISNADVTVELTAPCVESISASSGAEVKIVGKHKSKDLSLSASSGGEIKTLDIDANVVEISGSSGSDVETRNITCTTFNSQFSSGAELEMKKINADQTTIQTSSGSEASISNIIAKRMHLSASSGSEIDVDGFNGSDININTSSGASISATGVTAVTTFVNASSSSDVKISGRSTNITANSSSTSDIDLKKLKFDFLNFIASSHAEISISAALGGKHEGRTSSGGKLKIK